jgi:hypothetical protein
VEELWGCAPRSRPEFLRETGEIEVGPSPRSAIALTGNDAMTLYWAARDCIIAGAYSGAAVLLRRLIRHVTEEKANEAGTREEAERLLEFAEVLLSRPHEPPSERSANS